MGKDTPSKSKHAEEEKSTPAKRLKTDYGDVLRVVAGDGDEEQTFVVYKDVITQSSKFFHTATTSERWIEAAENVVRLPEHAPSTFKIYLDAMYNPEADLEDFVDLELTGPEASSTKQAREAVLQLAQAWVLGDYVRDVHFRNRVMKALLRIKKGACSQRMLDLVAKQAASESPLRKWAIEVIYRRGATRWNEEAAAFAVQLCPEVIVRELLLRALRDPRVKQQEPLAADSQEFLEPEDD